MNTRERKNPFLSVYQTPFSTIPFDKIKDEDYLLAFREGMKQQKQEIETIINNPETPTFENTILALENSGDLLSRVQYVFYNLLEAESSDRMQEIAEEISPEESEHSNAIFLSESLFYRVKYVYENKEKFDLDSEDLKLLDDTYISFVRRGANLDDAQKEKFREISKEMSITSLQFSQKLLKATNAFELYCENKSDLKGIPEDILIAAAEKATAKNKKGWIFDLSYPSYVPFMKYAENRELRQKMYMAYNTKAFGGDTDNQENVKKMVNLRLQMANLLGKKNYAEYVLQRRMAEKPAVVYELLENLLEAYRPVAEKELNVVRDFAKEKDGLDEVLPWDWSYYSNLLKMRDFDISDDIVKPYFELENVRRGVFALAQKLYGLQFRKNEKIPVYHSDVEAFEVRDENDEYLAVLYTDFHPRAGKQSGAWMTEFKPQWKEKVGNEIVNSRPHISLVMNFSRAVAEKPALLSFDELTTFLHEFGHALHGMLANTKYASMSGTSVYRDFVELPSQIMENFATEKEFLDDFAMHYQTQEKMPENLVKKIHDAENFNVGYACLRQLSFGFLDMAWHTKTEYFEGDVEEEEKKILEKTNLLQRVENTCMSVQFSHLFSGGYAAGYYGYKWAEVLDADAFSVFKKNGIFDRETATSFRKNILERGGTEHPMDLYMRFRGQKPTIDALLQRNGLKK